MKPTLSLVLAALLAPAALAQGMTITRPSGSVVTLPAQPAGTSPATSPAAQAAAFQATAAPVPADLPAGWRALTGRVRAPGEVRLPAGSRVTVSIEDVSRQDAPSTTLVRASFPAGRLSTPYTLQYGTGRVAARGTYIVTARVTGPDGRLLFLTTTQQPLPTLRSARMDLRVTAVR